MSQTYGNFKVWESAAGTVHIDSRSEPKQWVEMPYEDFEAMVRNWAAWFARIDDPNDPAQR